METRPTCTAFLALLTVLTACGPDAREPRPEGETPSTAASVAVASSTVPPSAPGSTAPERAAVVATVERLFDALRTGDAALLRSVMDPTVVMHFTETRDGATTYGSSTVDALATRITSSSAPLVERMWSPLVMVDGSLATLWAPYDFYVGSTFSHCGIDAATLVQGDDGWRIVALSWTRRQPPDCALHPDGPPS